MPNFNLPMPNLPNAKVSSGSADMGSVKLQMGQMYNARLETLGNQVSQVKIAVGQQTVSQPLPQLPSTIRPGQNYQVSVTTNKNGQAVLSFFPQQTQSATQAQVLKVSLTDAQLVNLLSLNKNYQAKPDGSVQTQAQVVLDGAAKTPALKLPAMPGTVKLPEGVGALLSQSKSLQVALSAKNGKVELQFQLPGAKAGAAPIKLSISADKLISAAKQGVSQSAETPLQVQTKGTTSPKVTLPNGQTLTLPSKVTSPGQNAQPQAQFSNLNQRQLTITVSSGQTTTAPDKASAQPLPAGGKTLATVTLDKANTVSALKTGDAPVQDGAKSAQPQQAAQKAQVQLQLSGDKIPTDKAMLSSNDKPITADKAQTQNAAQTAKTEQAATLLAAQTPAITQNRIEQKQALDKLIDPLIRVLLPKKMNWSEGLKNLATLEKQLPDSKIPLDPKQQAVLDKDPELKQVLTQLRNSIPDQNSPLTEKNIANILGSIMNYNPTSVTSTPQPTPSNAIANALQLLLGAKLVQNETKATPQVIQQLTTLLKNHTGKEEKTAKGIKALTNNLAQAELGSGSGALRSLSGLSATMRSQQLDNVEKKLDGNPQINVTMPLKVDDEIKELHLSINEDEEHSEKDNRKVSIWQLNLTFDLGDLGRMLVNAKLKDGELSMQMYAEKQGALTQINKFSQTLQERLEFHGVKIKQVQSSLGKISAGEGNKKLTSLLQIKV